MTDWMVAEIGEPAGPGVEGNGYAGRAISACHFAVQLSTTSSRVSYHS
jgi:hypothetical protein